MNNSQQSTSFNNWFSLKFSRVYWEKICRPYFIALRPWSFTASLTPVALGTALAYKNMDNFSLIIFIITCFTAISVHAAGNLVNTYYDFVKGVDSNASDDRTLVDHILDPKKVAAMGGFFYLFGCFGFALLVSISSAKMEHLALIYFGGLSGSFLYTGGMGLKYLALGDIVIFLTFGPVTVLFSVLAQGGQLSWSPLFYAIPLALNTECILHANNVRDLESDKQAGIFTLAIISGKTGSYLIFCLLLFSPYIILIVLILNFSKIFCLPFITIILAFKLERAFRSNKLSKLPNNISQMNLQFGLLFTLAILFCPKEQILL